MYMFIPLAAGTIADLFSQRRNTAPRSKPYDPLGLHPDSTCCAHVSVVDKEDGSGIHYIGCSLNADQDGRHGWLCQKHSSAAQQDDSRFPQSTRRNVIRNKDQEIVESIIASEERALRDGTREVVQIGAKTRIEFLN